MIHRWGLSLTDDWPAFFIHAAWDLNSNFTSDNMLRLSVGMRF